MKLLNKVVVVTGSTRGIGKALSFACASEGAKVVICSRNEKKVEQNVEIFRQNGFQASGIKVDVTNENDIKRLFSHAVETWGKIDIWVNNAGLSGGYQFLDKMETDEIRSIIEVNLTAVLLACRLVIPYFKKNGGLLFNISGKGGRGDASPFLTTYAATKSAVISLTKSLAKENIGYPVSIHALLPGMVKTDFYKDIKTSSGLEEKTRNIPLILKAIGVPKEDVGRLFLQVAQQRPGKATGKIYSCFKGFKLVRGISLLAWYRITKQI